MLHELKFSHYVSSWTVLSQGMPMPEQQSPVNIVNEGTSREDNMEVPPSNLDTMSQEPPFAEDPQYEHVASEEDLGGEELDEETIPLVTEQCSGKIQKTNMCF